MAAAQLGEMVGVVVTVAMADTVPEVLVAQVLFS